MKNKNGQYELGQKANMQMPVSVKKVDKENFTLTMVASTQGADRHGDTVIQSGWDLSQFTKNPVILNSHRYDDATEVIAKAVRTEVIGKGKRSKLEQDWIFAVNENPKAQIIFDLYAGGFLNASSVGFIPRKFKEDKDGNRDWSIIEEAELLEVSAVSVPANAQALAKEKGIEVDKLLCKENEQDEEQDPELDDAPKDNEVSETTEETTTEQGSDSEVGQEGTEQDPEPDTGDSEDQEASNETECDCEEECTCEESEVEEVEEPPVAQASYKKQVVKAISSIEQKRTQRLKKAHKIIKELIDDDKPTKIKDSQTVEKVRKRKLNQAIRTLVDSK